MLLRVEVPFIDRSVQRVRLVRWRKAPGEDITYGEVVCELVVEEIATLKRTITAHGLIRLARRGQAASKAAQTGSRALEFGVDLVASDQGVLRHQAVQPGAQLATGDLIGVVTTTADEPADGDAAPDAALVFRLAADLSQTDQESAG